MISERGPGRPEKVIDWNLVDEYIKRQCPGREIAGKFHMHEETFYKKVQEKWGINFTGYAGSLYQEGKADLRCKQYDMAISGNVKLLEKLGDVYLSQNKTDEHISDKSQQLNEQIENVIFGNKLEPETKASDAGVHSLD